MDPITLEAKIAQNQNLLIQIHHSITFADANHERINQVRDAMEEAKIEMEKLTVLQANLQDLGKKMTEDAEKEDVAIDQDVLNEADEAMAKADEFLASIKTETENLRAKFPDLLSRERENEGEEDEGENAEQEEQEEGQD